MDNFYYILWFAVGYMFLSIPVEILLQQLYGPGQYIGITVAVGILTAGLAGHIQNKRLKEEEG